MAMNTPIHQPERDQHAQARRQRTARRRIVPQKDEVDNVGDALRRDKDLQARVALLKKGGDAKDQRHIAEELRRRT
jgi:hypothetical protein